jgi:hypothetical protein
LNPEGKQVGRHAGVAGRRPVTKSSGKVDRYRAGNLEVAEVILADTERYGGEESLMVRWARLVFNPAAERTTPTVRRAA